jgi:hypothetical protein
MLWIDNDVEWGTCLPKSAMSVLSPLTEAARALPEALLLRTRR